MGGMRVDCSLAVKPFLGAAGAFAGMRPHRRRPLPQPEIIEQGIDAQETQQDHVDDVDEGIAQHGVLLVERTVDDSSAGRADDGPDEEGEGEFDRDVAQLLVDRRPHDGLGENVKQVGAHGEDSLDARAHESRRGDESPARSDATGDQPCAESHQDGNHEDEGRVVGRRIGFLASQHLRQVVGEDRPQRQDGDQHQQQCQAPIPAAQDVAGNPDFPPRLGHPCHLHGIVDRLQSLHRDFPFERLCCALSR